jgi:NAD(P)-dependent dehydrogenase (short-subunit alcohol dehydrogenase family)
MDAKNLPFQGSNALIFGGAKGIGRAVALEFARRGARVTIADIDQNAARETAAFIIAQGGLAVGLPANVLSDRSVAEVATAIEAQLGELDIVVNNVGSMLNGHPEDIPMEEWQRMMDLNYFSTIRSLKLFLPKFLARGRGHIVNTASFAGLYPYAASRMPYAASKAAMIALTQSLAIYLEPKGIRVSCLIPGPVMTGILASMTSWTPDCPMRGPGADLEIKDVEETAIALADGMRDGKIMISSDEKVWDIVRRWAASPDAFIRAKIEEFSQGDAGSPHMPEALKRKLGI